MWSQFHRTIHLANFGVTFIIYKPSLLPHEAKVHQSVDLLCRVVIVEVSEVDVLNASKSTLLLMKSPSSSELSESSNFGLSGGFIFFNASPSQSMELKKGCCLISCKPLCPSRFLGSLSSRPRIRLLAFSVTFLGNLSLPSLMFLYRVGMSSEK